MWQDAILEQENLHVSLRSARGRERSERNEHIHLRLCVPFRRLECCVSLAFTGLSRHDPMNLYYYFIVALTSEEEKKNCCVRRTHNCFVDYTHAT
jgi:hypothetical protein